MVSSPHRDFHLHLLELNGGTWFDFEPHLSAFYCAILQPGSIAVDGGANIGLHTLPMAQAVQPDGLIIAIEPVPEMLHQLRTRLHEFRIPEHLVRLVPLGLSSAPGAADFYQVLDPTQHGMSGLRNRSHFASCQVKQIRVELITLDAVCQDLDRLDFLKLDLEGAELDALRGGRATLERFRPVVALEQDQYSPQYFHYTWDDLIQYFASLRYELYDLFGLHYSRAEMFDQCPIWDFVGLPEEYPNRQGLFATARRSMENAGVKFDGAAPAKDNPRAGALSAQLRRRDQPTACVVDYLNAVSNPVAQVSIDVPANSAIRFSGWAVDEPNHSAAGGVDIVIDGVPYGAVYGWYRSDVADHFKNMSYLHSGFVLVLEPGTLAKGRHTVSLRTISHDKNSYYEGPALSLRLA